MPATSATHGPAALTSARARMVRCTPVRFVAAARQRHRPSVRSADTQAVRGAIVAPRSAASRAFSTTRRESSTQQSEYSKPAGEFGLQRRAGGIVAQPQRARRRQPLAAAEMVVEEQAKAQQPSRAQCLVVRQDEAQRPDDVRRDPPQHLALHQRLAHQTELVIFQIAQPAVDQLGRRAGGAGRQVARSHRNTRQPRPAASRAMPQPLMPPPMMARSYSELSSAASIRSARLLAACAFAHLFARFERMQR